MVEIPAALFAPEALQVVVHVLRRVDDVLRDGELAEIAFVEAVRAEGQAVDVEEHEVVSFD